MGHFKSAALGLAILTCGAGAATAQSDGAMAKSSMAAPSHMSAHQMHMMKSCKSMSHDMMMKNKGCMKMMKAHPEMMSDGMKNDSMGK